MSLEELLSQAYYSGMLALSIVFLGLAILAYPMIRRYYGPQSTSKKK